MYNETNEMLGNTEQNADKSLQGNLDYLNESALPYAPQSNIRGDLRTSPRLTPETMPRRRCDGSLGNSQANGSGRHGWGLEEYPLAMVYSPYQEWRQTYTPEVALGRGTLFGELDLPLEVMNCRRGC